MYRHGHVGLDFLIAAPIAYYLIQQGELALVGIGIVCLFIVEPLPDIDRILPGMSHRGTSHSLLAGVVIGAFCAAIAYWLTLYLIQTILQASFGQSVVVGSVPNTPFDPGRNARIGFIFGIGATILHLIGDSLTPEGVRPLLPFAPTKVSFEIVEPGRGWAEFLLFFFGLLVFGSVLVVSVPALGNLVGLVI